MTRPLMMAGTARGGTNLVVLILNAHTNVAAVQDPYLALFKSFRNAVVAPSRGTEFDLHSPLDEYYFFEERLAIMREIQGSALDLPLGTAELADLRAVLETRMKLAAPILIPYLERLNGQTYRDLMAAAFDVIGRARGKPDAEHLAFNDNWAIEFFLPVARSFPNARFVAILRDVRAALASHVRILEVQHKHPLAQYPKDRSILAMTLSFARCWRKHVAFAKHYQSLPELKGRFTTITYEDLVQQPETEARRLCEFLGVEYEPAMIDSANFIAGDGSHWIPVSNHTNVPESGIFSTTVDRWRQTLSDSALDLIEFVAGPELKLAGYALTRRVDDGFEWGAYSLHADQHDTWIGGGMGWRTDNKNPDIDFGLELLRWNCLKRPTNDVGLQERCFLFSDVYAALRDGGSLSSQ